MKCLNKKIKRSANGINLLSQNEKQAVYTAIAKLNEKLFKEKVEEMKKIITNNLFKIFVLVSNEEMGLGKIRIVKFLDKVFDLVSEISEDSENGLLVIEERCKKILGKETYKKYFKDIPFSVELENYDFVQNAQKN